jgi:hypothetical protein
MVPSLTTSNKSALSHGPDAVLPTKSLGQGTEYGVHDTMRYGLRCVKGEVTGAHPLEGVLSQVGLGLSCEPVVNLRVPM